MVDALTITPEVVPIPEKNIVSENYNAFAEIWNNSKKKLVLVGVLAPNSVEQHFIDILAEDESVLILTESTSNLHHDNICPSIDKLIGALSEEELKIASGDFKEREEGLEFQNPNHAFSLDVDLFGKGSFFQFIYLLHSTIRVSVCRQTINSFSRHTYTVIFIKVFFSFFNI